MKTEIKFKDLLVDHSYYCSDSNYYSNDALVKYDTWDDFYSEFGNSDLDFNLCFRFDVYENDDSDKYYAEVFMMQQRKGRFVPICIEEVNESNLEEIVKWLTPRWEYLKLLWKPIS